MISHGGNRRDLADALVQKGFVERKAFREGAKDGKRSVYSEVWTIDFKSMLDNLEKKFGGPMYICVRVHPQLAPAFVGYQNPDVQDRIINESQADDMYEILAAMDAYITDYSSACFEAGFARIPVFIYADDIEKYAKDRGALMWNLATDPIDNIRNNRDITPAFDVQFPFGVSRDNDELEDLILSFDEKAYNERLNELFEQIGLVFEGNASKRVTETICSLL